jgi:octaprenyl-diphosphate synthase
VEITEEDYFDIISAKTGALISAACRIGGILSGCPEEQEQALAAYGLKVGNSFQVADDILDYSADEEAFGKELGKDLDEGKVTLPLIYLLRHTSDSEREEISYLLDDGVTEDGLRRVLELFKKYNALEETRRKAVSLIDDAKKDLSIFPDCRERRHLFEIADYTLNRQK